MEKSTVLNIVYYAQDLIKRKSIKFSYHHGDSLLLVNNEVSAACVNKGNTYFK